MHEIRFFFWPKAFFWSIMKMTIRIFFSNMSQGPPNPGFMQEKVQKGDFLKKTLVRIDFFHMNSSKAWNTKLEAASFFCHLKTYTGSVKDLPTSSRSKILALGHRLDWALSTILSRSITQPGFKICETFNKEGAMGQKWPKYKSHCLYRFLDGKKTSRF